MSAEVGGFNQLERQVEDTFQTNMPGLDSTRFSTSATQTVPTDVMPRSVVDYTNAHTYINPSDPAVQALLHDGCFPTGVPTDPAEIIQTIHSFMAAKTTYISDGAEDDWAPVGDVAKRLSGDCEDLVHLEHSLLLAAFNEAGLTDLKPQSHAAYVTIDGQREGACVYDHSNGWSDHGIGSIVGVWSTDAIGGVSGNL